MKHLFSFLPLMVTCKIPQNSSLFECLRSHSCCPHFALQYVYETNENGDKVVLGKGTYGVVYAGRDLSNQVRIAIKEIPEKDSTYENQHSHCCYWTQRHRAALFHKTVFFSMRPRTRRDLAEMMLTGMHGSSVMFRDLEEIDECLCFSFFVCYSKTCRKNFGLNKGFHRWKCNI